MPISLDTLERTRAFLSLSEPELGSDVQAIKTSAKKGDDGRYEINGQKMWVTNGLRSGLVATLVKTDPDASKSALGRVARKEGFETYEVPPDVGARYSVLSAVGILPIAYAGVDTEALVSGAAECARWSRMAATWRGSLPMGWRPCLARALRGR